MTTVPEVDKNDDWTIYGSPTCPYCRRVLKYLMDRDIKFIFHTVSRNQRAELTKLSGRRTIPVIYRYGELIGGCDDFIRMVGIDLFDGG